MAKNLTILSTWATNVTVPEGGDLRRASTIEVPLQHLANRTAYLKDQVDVTGVRRLRYVATTTAAAALTGLTEGDCVLIRTQGLYRFFATLQYVSVTAPWQIAVTAGGYLCHVDGFSIDRGAAAYPLGRDHMPVVTGPSGKVLYPDVLPNRVIFDRFFAPDTVADPLEPTAERIDDITTYGDWQGLVHSSEGVVNVNIYGAEANDILVFQMSGSAYVSNSAVEPAKFQRIQGFVNLGVTDAPIPGAIATLSANLDQGHTAVQAIYHNFSLLGRYAMPSDAGVSAVVRPLAMIGSATTTLGFLPGVSMRVTCVRA